MPLERNDQPDFLHELLEVEDVWEFQKNWVLSSSEHKLYKHELLFFS